MKLREETERRMFSSRVPDTLLRLTATGNAPPCEQARTVRIVTALSQMDKHRQPCRRVCKCRL